MNDIATDEIQVDDAPAIAGLRFRHFAGDEDFPRMIAVLEATKVHDKIERVFSVGEITRQYSHLTNSDPRRDMLMVEIDGELVGYNRTWWAQFEGGPRIYAFMGHVVPAWRGRGIGRAALGYIEQHLRRVAADQAYDGERIFMSDASDSQTEREALLLSAGYEPMRHGYHMERSLADPIEISPMPEGIEVRPVTPELVRTVWNADVEAFRDHWGFVEPTETDYQNMLSSPDFNAALWRVGFDIASGEPAGMVLNFMDEAENAEYKRLRGYTENISVRRPWRKRGLARALLTRSLQMFKDMGMTEAALGVDTQNQMGALRLYESVGFKAVRRETVYRKGMD